MAVIHFEDSFPTIENAVFMHAGCLKSIWNHVVDNKTSIWFFLVISKFEACNLKGKCKSPIGTLKPLRMYISSLVELPGKF